MHTAPLREGIHCAGQFRTFLSFLLTSQQGCPNLLSFEIFLEWYFLQKKKMAYDKLPLTSRKIIFRLRGCVFQGGLVSTLCFVSSEGYFQNLICRKRCHLSYIQTFSLICNMHGPQRDPNFRFFFLKKTKQKLIYLANRAQVSYRKDTCRGERTITKNVNGGA